MPNPPRRKQPQTLSGMIEARAAAVVPINPEASTALQPASNPAITKVTLYIPKRAYKFIKQTALDYDRKPHDLIMDGIDLMLAKYGKSLADFEDAS